MAYGNEMICPPVTLSGYAEWPKVADAMIEAAHWTSDVESTVPLDVMLRHDLWTPFWCLMSCK